MQQAAASEQKTCAHAMQQLLPVENGMDIPIERLSMHPAHRLGHLWCPDHGRITTPIRESEAHECRMRHAKAGCQRQTNWYPEEEAVDDIKLTDEQIAEGAAQYMDAHAKLQNGTYPTQRINKTWIKENTGPAFTLVARGEDFLTLIAALGYEMDCGPGAMYRRHARNAHHRIVHALPLGTPEITLHRSELLALVDGLDHLSMISVYQASAWRLLVEIINGVSAQIRARSHA